jgi:hypothetical protein
MAKYLLVGVFCILLSKTLYGQLIYTGSFDLKNQATFSLVSENETVTVQIAKKQIEIESSARNSFGFKKLRRNQFIFFNNSDTSQVVQTKKKITFQSGLFFVIKKGTAKELILLDSDGKIALTAEHDFKYPIANYKFYVYDETKLPELVSYATYYFFEKSKALKTDYETPYIFFW